MKIVLSVNAGSSSVKISAYTADRATSPQQIAEAQISGLTAPPAKLKYSRYGKSIVKDEQVGKKVDVQDAAFSLLLDTLIDDGELFLNSLVFHYASDVGKLSPASTEHLHISRAEEILNKQSGWKALTGTTDFGVIASSDEPQHKLAFDIFVDRVCGFVGSYYVALEGQVDALVFAGGIGEKSSRFRDEVVRRTQCLGFSIDEGRNSGRLGQVVEDIGSHDARHRVLVCQTDEQFEMARAATEKSEVWT